MDPWGSNTIYPWKEHKDLSLAKLPANSTAQINGAPHQQVKSLTRQQLHITTSPIRDGETEQSETYSEWNSPWYFPHGCCELLPVETFKGPPQKKKIKCAVTHFIAISSSSTKGERDKILQDRRWGCDSLENEGVKWLNKSELPPQSTWMEHMEICMQSIVVGRHLASFRVCVAPWGGGSTGCDSSWPHLSPVNGAHRISVKDIRK